ncbi:MAG: type II toxin-antitoxin system HicB family antitoxin [Alphaproteobacteria bacterium]|nr:type II toxin-antitoxin system HicB family antitoxin [Alphaproteobacteria bacterium]MBV8409621.1 type II toxin-antitoxin system HicB family antitoxin [Alphaproteobacteria bacterium]
MAQFYVAVLETNSAGEIFVFVPDLPGVTAAAATEQEALNLAIEFANDYVRDLARDGHPVPEPRRMTEIERDPEVQEIGRALIPVERALATL